MYSIYGYFPCTKCEARKYVGESSAVKGSDWLMQIYGDVIGLKRSRDTRGRFRVLFTHRRKMPRQTHYSSKNKRIQLLAARAHRGKVTESRSKQETQPATASSRKLSFGKLQGQGEESSQTPATQEWLLVHVARLNELVSGLVCPECAGYGLHVIIDPKNHGFCSSVLLQCSLCEDEVKYSRSVYTSTRLQEESSGNVAFDVNVRMVLLAHELGMGHAALKKISKVLGIPGLHVKTYQRHDRRVKGRQGGLRQCTEKINSKIDVAPTQ